VCLELIVMPAQETVNPIRLGINLFPAAGFDDGIRVVNDGFMAHGEATISRDADVIDHDTFFIR
jgi:hypothetical protein